MQIPTWLDMAQQDAERRGLPELKPLLAALARSLEALRAHDRLLDERRHVNERDGGSR
jgi:hypothetical protein